MWPNPSLPSKVNRRTAEAASKVEKGTGTNAIKLSRNLFVQQGLAQYGGKPSVNPSCLVVKFIAQRQTFL